MFRPGRWLILWLVCVSFMPLQEIIAQTAEPTVEAEDTTALVLDALHSVRANSYHFSLERLSVSSKTDADKTTETIVYLTTASGEVAANGDVHLVVLRSFGQSVSQARQDIPIKLEFVIVDRVTYLFLSDDLATKLDSTVFASGWNRLDNLPKSYEGIRAGLQEMIDGVMPSTLLRDADFFRVIRELDREKVNDVDTRVFDMQVDTLSLIMSQLPGTALDKLLDLFRKRVILLPSAINYRGRAWIDSETGHLLHLDLDFHATIPSSVTAPDSSGEVYDQDVRATINLTLSHYGEPVEIEAPVTIPR